MVEKVTAEGSRQVFRHESANVEGGGVQIFITVLLSLKFCNTAPRVGVSAG